MPMSPEARDRLSRLAKERHAKEAARREEEQAALTSAKEEPEATEEIPTTHIDEAAHGVSQEEYALLLRRFVELEQKFSQAAAAPLQNPQVSPRGSLVGTYEKYVVDPAHYTDPTDRLAREPKLLRVPFKSRADQAGGYYEYDLVFDISTVSYQTQDGVNTIEPKFNLKLNRYILDEDTDLPTNRAYTACQLIFHEDPQAALVIARDHGLTLDRSNEAEFLDEMRYLRMRDWLLESFFPPKPNTEKKTKEMVIGNKLVTVFEATSVESERFDFSKLNNKL